MINCLTWWLITYSWVFKGGREETKKILENSESLDDVIEFQYKVWRSKGRHYPDHWVVKQFMLMCDEEIVWRYENERREWYYE